MRREFTLVLLAGAAGAGLVVLAARQAWAQAVFTPPRPLPAQDIPSGLAFADVLVIYAQPGASDAELLALGASWATPLSRHASSTL